MVLPFLLAEGPYKGMITENFAPLRIHSIFTRGHSCEPLEFPGEVKLIGISHGLSNVRYGLTGLFETSAGLFNPKDCGRGYTSGSAGERRRLFRYVGNAGDRPTKFVPVMIHLGWIPQWPDSRKQPIVRLCRDSFRI